MATATVSRRGPTRPGDQISPVAKPESAGSSADGFSQPPQSGLVRHYLLHRDLRPLVKLLCSLGRGERQYRISCRKALNKLDWDTAALLLSAYLALRDDAGLQFAESFQHSRRR